MYRYEEIYFNRFSFIVPRSLLLFGSEEISQEREDQESPKQMKEIERIQRDMGERARTYNSYSFPYFLSSSFSGLLSGSINQKNLTKKKNQEKKEKNET